MGTPKKINVFPVFCGLTKSSDSAHEILFPISDHLKSQLPSYSKVEKDVVDEYNRICDLYDACEITSPILIVIDAIDQLRPYAYAQTLAFLPRKGHEKIRVLFSGTYDSEYVESKIFTFKSKDIATFQAYKLEEIKPSEISGIVDGILLLGCGIIFATCRDQYSIKLQRFDLETGKIIDCDCDDEISFKGVFSVTVEELISLYGGLVLPENPQPSITADKQDIDLLWDMARGKLSVWNDSVKYLTEFEKRSDNKMNVSLELAPLKTSILNYHQKMSFYRAFLQELSKKGIISGLKISSKRGVLKNVRFLKYDCTFRCVC